MKNTLIYPFLFTFFIAFSQEKYNPFEGIGKSTEVVTLSNGKYKEIYGGDTLKKIENVIFDTKNNKVVQFLAEDDTVTMVVKKEGDYATRWLSLDPLAAKYPSMSPYNFVGNSPILFIDPDGRVVAPAPGLATEIWNQFKATAGEETKAQIKLIEESEIVYRIIVVTNSEEGGSTQIGNKNSETGYYDVNLILRVNDTPNDEESQAYLYNSLGDEVTHAEQIEKGELGVAEFIDGALFNLGYDIEDESASKEGAIRSAEANNVKLVSSAKGYDEQVKKGGQSKESFFNNWKSNRGNSYGEVFGRMGFFKKRDGNMYNENKTVEQAGKKVLRYMYKEKSEDGKGKIHKK